MVALTGAVALATTALGASTATAALQSPAHTAAGSSATTYIVLADTGVSTGQLARTVSRAGATVTGTNEAIGMLTVTSTDAGFAARARALDGVRGAAADRSIGQAPTLVPSAPDPVEQESPWLRMFRNARVWVD